MATRQPKRTCRSLRADGTPCANSPKSGSQFCRWHDGEDGRVVVMQPGTPDPEGQKQRLAALGETLVRNCALFSIIGERLGLEDAHPTEVMKQRPDLAEMDPGDIAHEFNITEKEFWAAVTIQRERFIGLGSSIGKYLKAEEPSEGEDAEDARPTKRRRSKAECVPVPPLTVPARMSTHHPLNMALMSTFFSKEGDWRFEEHINSFVLNTPNGCAVAEQISTLPVLQRLLSLTGAEGLQFTCGAIAAYTGTQKSQHGRLPDYRECTPVTVSAADLLRAMGRRPQGKRGGYSRDEQLKARQFLRAVATFSFANVKQLGRTGVLEVGPVLVVLGTRAELKLPFEQEDPADESVVSITFMLGEGFWDMVKRGRHWVPPQLLQMHPVNDKYAIAAGFYLTSLLMVRRNKEQDGDPVALETIEHEAQIDSFDKRPTVRLAKLEEALHKLARVGIIGGIETEDGLKADIEDSPTAAGKSAVEAMRSRRLRLTVSPTLRPYLCSDRESRAIEAGWVEGQ